MTGQFVHPDPKQFTMPTMMQKQDTEDLDKLMGRFFYECAVPFNVADQPSFKQFISAVSQHGHQYKGYSSWKLRNTMLDTIWQETEALLKPIKDTLKVYGGTIISDGWTDRVGRALMNLLLNTGSGVVFLFAEDLSSKCFCVFSIRFSD